MAPGPSNRDRTETKMEGKEKLFKQEGFSHSCISFKGNRDTRHVPEVCTNMDIGSLLDKRTTSGHSDPRYNVFWPNNVGNIETNKSSHL